MQFNKLIISQNKISDFLTKINTLDNLIIKLLNLNLMSLTNPFQSNSIPTTPVVLSPVDYHTVQLLRQQGQLSRIAIAEQIGYSPSKITGVVNNLLKEGIVQQQDVSTYTGGRPAKDLFFNPQYGYLLSISISNDKLDIALVDFSEQVRIRRMLPIEDKQKPSQILQSMTNFVLERLKKFEIPLNKVLGIGVSLSSNINLKENTPFNSSGLVGWGGYQIMSFLRETFPHSVVQIEKDANAMAFAEMRKGRGKGYHHIIYLTIEQTVRSGLIINGSICRGASGRAGNIGEVLVLKDTDLQSLNALLEDLPLTNERDLSAIALEGNDDALAIIEQAGQYIGRVLSTMITLLDPQLILIGGRASALGHPFLAAIRRSIFNYSQSISTQHLQVELAPLKDASLIGMTALTAERIFVPAS